MADLPRRCAAVQLLSTVSVTSTHRHRLGSQPSTVSFEEKKCRKMPLVLAALSLFLPVSTYALASVSTLPLSVRPHQSFTPHMEHMSCYRTPMYRDDVQMPML